MELIHGYRNDKNLRDSFNALAEQTFDGLNFEGWYQNGFWGDNYDPHSIVIDGQVVSNVSVNRTDLLMGGNLSLESIHLSITERLAVSRLCSIGLKPSILA